MGLYQQFETDPNLEREGIWIDYGEFRVRLRHAGGANKAYASILEITTKPFRRAIDQGVFPEERMKKLLIGVYAKTMIAGWETSQTDAITGETSWVPGVEDRDGKLETPGEAAYVRVLNDLPWLFMDLIQQGNLLTNYRIANLEADSGN